MALAKASTKWDGEVGPHGVGVGAPSSAMHGPLNPWGPEPSSQGKSRIKIQDRPALSLPQIAGKLPYPALHQLQELQETGKVLKLKPESSMDGAS
ncbi:hypothetical protein CKAH01_11577 [Colletotrichum kahawae]|uniref:Uncharacterized protein n=1 Tax=Colletotrichum kahawae TaxID=34407 RepID=A0AAD9YVR3_COLKA|nr:hypothetical protein CcaCcLH18_03293 [Colletotrichum camelliae]KAK2778803.1 hypothetical protein CKAH01_11577 [Colletotrichum kahawae]